MDVHACVSVTCTKSGTNFVMPISQLEKCKCFENWNPGLFMNVDSKYAVSFHKLTMDLLIFDESIIHLPH